MTISSLLIALLVVGVVMALVPMDARFKNLIYVVAVVLVIVILLKVLLPVGATFLA